MTPRIIGVTGFKRSGKDTFARVLSERAGYVRVAFADALKEEVAAFLGISLEELERDKELWRPVLQHRGVSMRQKNPNHWIDRVAYRITTLIPARVVITDVRFLNEAAWVRSRGGMIVRVVRNGVLAADQTWHVSEREVALIKPDGIIDACSVVELTMKATALLKEWGER